MDTKKWTLLLAMMGVLIATAFANNPIDEDIDASVRKKDGIIDKIAPVMDKQRAKLEEVMNDEDVKTVEVLKKDLKDQRLMLHELQCEAGAARIQGEKPDESLRQEIRAQMTVISNIYSKAGDVADKYENTIEGLLEEVKEEVQVRRGDNDEGGRPGMRPTGKRGASGRPSPGGMFERPTPEVRFLLWDGVNI